MQTAILRQLRLHSLASTSKRRRIHSVQGTCKRQGGEGVCQMELSEGSSSWLSLLYWEASGTVFSCQTRMPSPSASVQRRQNCDQARVGSSVELLARDRQQSMECSCIQQQA